MVCMPTRQNKMRRVRADRLVVGERHGEPLGTRLERALADDLETVIRSSFRCGLVLQSLVQLAEERLVLAFALVGRSHRGRNPSRRRSQLAEHPGSGRIGWRWMREYRVSED